MVIKHNELKIVFENELLLIVDKPVGMLSHPDAHLKEIDILSYLKTSRPESRNYAVINRLDFNTSGLVIVGKTMDAIKVLNKASLEKQIQKTYLCAVSGYFFVPEATLEAYLLKDSTQSRVRISNVEVPNSQKIMTHYKVLKEAMNMSLVEVELLTGKTHQIRAHLAMAEHPIIGDPLYGQATINKKIGLKTQALIAYKLTFSNLEPSSILYPLNNRSFQINQIPFMILFNDKKPKK